MPYLPYQMVFSGLRNLKPALSICLPRLNHTQAELLINR